MKININLKEYQILPGDEEAFLSSYEKLNAGMIELKQSTDKFVDAVDQLKRQLNYENK
jgi:hypothetical protein